MLFKRDCAFFLLFFAILLHCGATHASTAALKLAHTSEPNTPLGFGAEKLAELAHMHSNGAISIKVFHSGQIGEQRKLVESLRYGLIDMAMVNSSFLAEYVPGVRVFELPFIFRNSNHAYHALDTVGMDVAKGGELLGFKTLAFMESTQRNLCSGVVTLSSPHDLRGRYMGVRKEARFSHLMLFYMGARPINITDADLDFAVIRGDIDGQECTPGEIWERPFASIQKYISMTAHSYSAESVLISMAVWERLGQPEREALLLAAREAADWQRGLCRKVNADFLLKLHTQGQSKIVYRIDRRPFEDAVKPVWKIFASEVANGQQIIDRIREVP